MVVVEVNGLQYYMDNRLKATWDNIREGRLIKKDEDRVYIVDGREGSGKSVFAFQQACYLDPTLPYDLSRICFSADEFVEAIRKAEKGQAIVFDEAFRGLSSRSALSKTNKRILQALMEMRQRNLFVFIVLPSFFLLDIYPAMLRSNALFHVYRDKDGNRGPFKVYNYKKKALLYQIGLKKGWSYGNPRTEFKGMFRGKYPLDEAAYRKKKDDSLREAEVEKKDEESEYRIQRDIFMANWLELAHKHYKISAQKAEKLMASVGLPFKKSFLWERLEFARENRKIIQYP